MCIMTISRRSAPAVTLLHAKVRGSTEVTTSADDKDTTHIIFQVCAEAYGKSLEPERPFSCIYQFFGGAASSASSSD